MLRDAYTLFLLCAAWLFAYPLWPQALDVPPPPKQEELHLMSSNIREKLMSLRTEAEITKELCSQLQVQLIETSDSLKLSKDELKQSEELRTRLSVSLMSIQQQLNSSLDTIIIYEERLKARAKVITVLMLMLVIRTIGMLIGFIAAWKHIPLPRWLDILL